MKKHVDAQTYLSSLRVKERIDKGILDRDTCSPAVLQGVEHVEKQQCRTQAHKDKQVTLYNTVKVRPLHLYFLLMLWDHHHHYFLSMPQGASLQITPER
jgi:hypothetical protein